MNNKHASFLSFGFAFTIAEILLVLGIIGIVAEMTIPTVVASTQKQQYVTRLKKVYSNMNQVLTSVMADSGCIGDMVCTGLFDPTKNSLTLGTEIVKYFKVSKKCASGASGCMADSVSDYFVEDEGPGRYDWSVSPSEYRFITADGMSISLFSLAEPSTPACDGGTCANVNVDVNGPQEGPNTYGRDIFYFEITKNGVLDPKTAYWKDASGKPQTCLATNSLGWWCAGRIIEQGWQMNY